MVPDPESINNLDSPVSIITEQALRLREGTQVPDPRIVTVISMLAAVIDVLSIAFPYFQARCSIF